jgi:beta-glucosidase
MARIDDANRRILTKKLELGLFEKPFTDRSYTSTVGSAAHRDLARQAVRQSQVLLKNSGALPIAKSAKVFVAGKSADDIGNQSGGWTITWQGGSGPITPGTTILQGIRNTAANVRYDRAGDGVDRGYDVAVAVVGETPYAEGEGDRPDGLALDQDDLGVIAKLKAAGIPVVVVLVSGRPLDIAPHLSSWNAALAAWLPGTEGQGVADVLFGDHNPTGKLPVTWMASSSQQPINDGDGKTPLFPLGFGLSYQPTTTTTTTTPPPGGCTATSRIVSAWSGGFQAEITVSNQGSTPLSGWTVGWSRPADQSIGSLWNGKLGQTSTSTTVDNVDWNGSVGPGATTGFGLSGSGSATFPELSCRTH